MWINRILIILLFVVVFVSNWHSHNIEDEMMMFFSENEIYVETNE